MLYTRLTVSTIAAPVDAASTRTDRSTLDSAPAVPFVAATPTAESLAAEPDRPSATTTGPPLSARAFGAAPIISGSSDPSASANSVAFTDSAAIAAASHGAARAAHHAAAVRGVPYEAGGHRGARLLERLRLA